MPETDELEPQQYERRYWEDDVPLKDVRKNALRRSVYIGAGLFVLIMIAGSLIKFPDEVTLPFVLRGETPERIYRFPYPVYIEGQYTAPGKQVKKGEHLIKITSPQIVTLVNNYKQAEDALANFRAFKVHSIEDTREIVKLQEAQNAHSLQEVKQKQVALEHTWKSNETRLTYELEDANKRLEQHRGLYKTKDISLQELKTFELAQVRAADSLTSARESYIREANVLREESANFSLQNTSLTRQEDRNSFDASTDSSTLINNVALTRDAILHTFGDFEIASGSLILNADADGVLSFVFEGEREVPASATLLKLTHSSSGIYASVISPPSLIGKLQKGQVSYLKVATFPAYEWGAAKGHIDYLSLTPDEKGLFNIKVTIDEQRKLANRLQPGMNGMIAIQLDEKTFFQYFFRNMRKAKYVLSGGE